VNAHVRARARGRPSVLGELRAAVSLLTRVPLRALDGAPRANSTGSAAFAAVGAGLGLAAAVPAALLAGIAPLLGAFLALAAFEFLTGALHLDGLADTADALAAPDPVRAEAARKDPRVGSAGAGAIVLVLGCAAGALVAIPAPAVAGGLVLAGTASRAVPAIGRSAGSPAAAGFGAWFAANSGPGGALTAVVTCALAGTAVIAVEAALGAGAPVATGAAVAGIAAGLIAGLLLLFGLGRRFGATVGDHHGAAIEVASAAALAAQAMAWGVLR
jgi:adenosylcobinamide-GDP ribazoletransferase